LNINYSFELAVSVRYNNIVIIASFVILIG